MAESEARNVQLDLNERHPSTRLTRGIVVLIVVPQMLTLFAACSSSHQLPSETTVGEIRYRATTSVLTTNPVVLRSVLTVTNIGNGVAQVEISATCPFSLEVFTTSARVGPPAWSQAGQQCAAVARVVSFAPGESRSFDSHATAREILGDSLTAARYYFVAVIQPSGRALRIEAGDVLLKP